MNAFQMIDEVMSPAAPHEQIGFRHKNPLLTLIVAAAGIVLAIWSLESPALKDNSNLTSILMLTGGITALVALIRFALIIKTKTPIFNPTGETIHRKEFYYEPAAQVPLIAALGTGSLQKVRSIERGQNHGGLLLTLYTTDSGSFAMAQLSHYVSYSFEPLCDVMRLKAD